MKITTQLTVGEIAALVNAKVVGDKNQLVSGINEIHRVEDGDIAFVDHPKYYDTVLASAATVILIDKETDCPPGKALLVVDAPFDAFNFLTRLWSPYKPQTSTIGENCQIASSAHLAPNCFVGHHVVIGERVTIHPGAYIGDGTILEENVIVGPNAVIGHYGFYYKKKPEGYDRMHSCGYVHLEKDVEIGAGTTIDAGVTSVTRIGAGTKIDNQVQIGHDTVVGKNCLFAAGVGVAGCVTIEDNVTLWGQVGCASGLTIGKGATVYAQSGISKDLEGGKSYFGSPCSDARAKYREMAAVAELPELLSNLRK